VDTSSITVPLAFFAGFLSFISPCVLPLVPVYLGYLSGSSINYESPPSRWQVFSHALLFVGGFTLVFVLLFGLPTTLLGNALNRYSGTLARLGGLLVIVFGLHTMGLITIPFLNMTRRLEAGQMLPPGHLRSGVFGVTFAAGWTPCIGPLLGAVMSMALTQPSQGMFFTLIYALGLAVPFLVSALLLTRATNFLRRLNRHARLVEMVSGGFMVTVGLLLVTGMFTILNSYFIRLTPQWLLVYL